MLKSIDLGNNFIIIPITLFSLILLPIVHPSITTYFSFLKHSIVDIPITQFQPTYPRWSTSHK